MLGALLAGVGSSVASKGMNALFGGDDKADTNKQDSLGINSVMNGNQNPNEMATPSEVEGSQSDDFFQGMAKDAFQTGFNTVMSKGVQSAFSPSASELGKRNKQYMEAAYPNLNEWERAGAAATSAGVAAGQQDNQKQMLQMQLSNQKDIAEINAKTQKEVAGIQSMTSRQNTKDQVYAQNTKLDAELKKLGAEATNIMQQTNLSTTQQSKLIVEMVTEQLKQQGIRLTNEQIPLLNKKIQAEIERLKYGKSSFGATTNDIGNVVMDAVTTVAPQARDFWNWSKGQFEKFSKGTALESLLK